MKGVVVHGAGDVRVEDLPEPVAGLGEVVVAVEWGGICGSDISYYRHGSTGTAVIRAPMVLGHEIAGRVVEVGAHVDGVPVGDLVAVHPATPDEGSVLPDRLAGRPNLHSRVRHLGSAAFVPHTDGGFVQHKAIRHDQLRRLPPGFDTRQGALAEPLGVALHAVRRAGDVHGIDVLVNGVGPIGCLVVAAARRAGARTVTAADVNPAALELAGGMGADHLIDTRCDALPEHLIVFEASGSPDAVGPVLAATARGGTVVQVGNLPGEPAPAALGQLVTRELTWIGSYRFIDEISESLAAMADGLDVSPLITREFDLAEAEAALTYAADSATVGKVMLRL